MNREIEGKKVRSFGLWLTNGKKKAALSTFLPFLWTLGGKWKTNKKKRANKLHHKERYLMPAVVGFYCPKVYCPGGDFVC